MPISRHVRMTRTAISPRLATSTFRNDWLTTPNDSSTARTRATLDTRLEPFHSPARHTHRRLDQRRRMSQSGKGLLARGLTYSRSVKVTDEMSPAHLRQEPIRVLSTPDMIRLVEQTAIEAVARHLAAGQATVGTRVDIAHLAATPVGMSVTIAVELVEIDRRRLGFRFEVRDELAEVGRGTHERII